MPGSTPATSQLDWLISTTAMIVLSWSRATRDLLKSFGWGIGALHWIATATMVASRRRLGRIGWHSARGAPRAPPGAGTAGARGHGALGENAARGRYGVR